MILHADKHLKDIPYHSWRHTLDLLAQRYWQQQHRTF